MRKTVAHCELLKRFAKIIYLEDEAVALVTRRRMTSFELSRLSRKKRAPLFAVIPFSFFLLSSTPVTVVPPEYQTPVNMRLIEFFLLLFALHIGCMYFAALLSS